MNSFMGYFIPVTLAWFGGFCIGLSVTQGTCKSGDVVVKTDSAAYRCVANKLVEVRE